MDETGELIRGDILGILAAQELGISSIAAPVSCNTALEKSGFFEHVRRVKIGSPFVIQAMLELQESQTADTEKHKHIIAGYEANGGFLTASELKNHNNGAILSPLPTRDAALPVIAVLAARKKRNIPLSELSKCLPARFTYSGILRNFPSERGIKIIEFFGKHGRKAIEKYLTDFGSVQSIDLTDGCRMIFNNGDIIHFRPSGNAPEFRCYTESSTIQAAKINNNKALKIIEDLEFE